MTQQLAYPTAMLLLTALLLIAVTGNTAAQQKSIISYKNVEIKRHPLPFNHKKSDFEARYLSASDYVDSLQILKSLLTKLMLDTTGPIDLKRKKIYDLNGIIGELKERAYYFKSLTLCGRVDNSVDVETYVMKNGIPVSFMTEKSRPVGLIRWNTDLQKYFQGANDNPGEVNGRPWGSGCLVGEDTFITAGHCFDPLVEGRKTPVKNGIILKGEEFASYMNVIFNYQKAGMGESIRNDSMSFPIIKLLEYRENGLDYAIIKLGKSRTGQTAGKVFGSLKMVAKNYENNNDTLMIIQHPDGEPKRVDCGPLFFSESDYLFYNNIDTKSISSGSPIINYSTGLLEGIHVEGDCSESGGTNQGVKLQSILKISKVIK